MAEKEHGPALLGGKPLEKPLFEKHTFCLYHCSLPIMGDYNRMADADKTYRIAFVHPDLGIGGAERLVVDAAVGLQNLGHDVEIFTSWHDRNHCFEPTRDGESKMQMMPTRIRANCTILQAL
jgi:hypothetical protein